jgi:hypothetical protein
MPMGDGRMPIVAPCMRRSRAAKSANLIAINGRRTGRYCRRRSIKLAKPGP